MNTLRSFSDGCKIEIVSSKGLVKLKKALFIVNPKSGKGTIKGQLLDVINILNQKEIEVTVRITQQKKDAERIARENAGDYELLICSGGDGTMDEVATGLMQGGHKIPVGYIPAGSTNDFANSLKLPIQTKAAAEVVTQNNPYACDIGSFNGDYFIYIAAFGILTEVSYQTNQDMKNLLGHMAYILEGAKRIWNVKSYHMKIRTGEREIEGEFIYGMVTNSESVGGFKSITGKNVRLDDGVFEVTLIRTPKNVSELQDILVSLMNREMNSKYIETFKTERVEFLSDVPISWTLDGEDGGRHNEVTILNHRQAISIMVKKDE